MPAQSKENVLPWRMPLCQRPPALKHDHWSVLDEWVLRSHGTYRTQPFNPLRSSTFPLSQEGGEGIGDERVTIAFVEGQDEPIIVEDLWTTFPTRETRAMWKENGKWKGYTFFRRQSQNTKVPQHDLPNEERAATSHDDCVDDVTDRLERVSISVSYARGSVVARGKATCSLKPGQPADDTKDESFEVVSG